MLLFDTLTLPFITGHNYAGAQLLAFGRALHCACSNTCARGTICDYGGPILAETDGPGGPLVAGDHLFRDSHEGQPRAFTRKKGLVN